MKKKFIIPLIVSAMTACTLLFVGCTQKQKAPEELLAGAFDFYKDAIIQTDIAKTIQTALTDGVITVSGQEGDESAVTTKYSLSEGVIVFANEELEHPLGVNLLTFKEDFPTSVFGVQGANILEIDEKQQNTLLSTFDDVLSYINKEQKAPDILDSILDYSTLSAEYNVEAIIDGSGIKADKLTMTMTKAQLFDLARKAIRSIDESVQEPLVTLFEMLTWDEYDSLEQIVIDMLDEEFKHVAKDDTAVSIQMLLDKKYNAALQVVIEIKNSKFVITAGTDPTNITEINLSITVDGKTETAIFSIDKDSITDTYTFKYQDKDKHDVGLFFEIDKAHCTFNIYAFEGSAKEVMQSYKYKLTTDSLTISYTEDDICFDVTFNTKAESLGEYKNILFLSEDEARTIVEQLNPSLDYDDDFDFDWDWDFDSDEEWWNENPSVPDVDTEGE